MSGEAKGLNDYVSNRVIELADELAQLKKQLEERHITKCSVCNEYEKENSMYVGIKCSCTDRGYNCVSGKLNFVYTCTRCYLRCDNCGHDLCTTCVCIDFQGHKVCKNCTYK